MHIVLAGGSGFLGKAICREIARVHGTPNSILSHKNVLITILSRKAPTFDISALHNNESSADSASDSRNSTTITTNPPTPQSPQSPPTSLKLAHKSIDLSEIQENANQYSELTKFFARADLVVNLVGIMHESGRNTFTNVQWKWPRILGEFSKKLGDLPLIHVSAIGARQNSEIPYQRTKGLGEFSIRKNQPKSIIIRPSLVFGLEDDFFNRFWKLLNYMPFLPYFGDGSTKFQPVHVQDLARLIVRMIESPKTYEKLTFEVGGPKIYSYKELMQLVIDHSGKTFRFLLPLPWFIGLIQGSIMSRLPVNLFTITRDQVKLLQEDNIVDSSDRKTVKKSNSSSYIHTFADAGITNLISIEEYFGRLVLKEEKQ